VNLTYLYCLVRSDRRPALRRLPEGLPASRPARLLDAGDGLWLVVADVTDIDYGEAAIDRGLKSLEWVSARAIGHEAVVEHFLGAGTVLPMQLFTIFRSDDRALDHVARDRQRIDRLMKRLKGQVELGLRLTWNESAVREAVEREHQRKPRGDGKPTGAAYLGRKRDLLAVNRTRLMEARTAATRLYRELSKQATEAKRRTSTEQAAPGSRLLLDAAYLVPTRKAAAFRAAVKEGVREASTPGIVASVTGPWPPYNFIDSPPPSVPRRPSAPSQSAPRRTSIER
jgi:hypothetical protein